MRVTTAKSILICSMLGLIAATTLVAAAVDGSRVKWDPRTRVFANIQASSGTEKGGIFFSRPEPAGPLFMAERRADGSPSPDRASITLDSMGRAIKVESKDGTHSIAYTKDGAYASSRGKKGSWAREIRTDKPVSDAALLPFLVGSFDLSSVDQGMEVSLVLFKDDGIDEYGAYLKVLRKERLATKVGTYDTLVIELSMTGLVGLIAPKIPIWIDEGTRMTVKMGFPKSSLDLIELK